MAKNDVKIEILRDSTGAFYLIDENGKRRKIGLRELFKMQQTKREKEKAEEMKRLRAIMGCY
jgi:hypothetical protein